nr:ATP-binding protein [Paenibacillus piri]
MYILFAFALVVTMSFPIDLNGLIFDFRSIPLVIGALYGGTFVSALLFFTLILYRDMLGAPHNWYYFFAILPGFILLVLSLKPFQSLKLYPKMFVSILLCTVIKLFAFGLYLSLTGQLTLLTIKPASTLITYLLQACIVGFYVYLLEFLNGHFQMQDEIVKSEKIKMIGEMAASVAHEIRNPLTTVRGFIQLFGNANLEPDKKEIYQKICLDELDRAQLIITDYLTLAKPDPDIVEKINVNGELDYLSNVLLTYANYNRIQVDKTPSENNDLCILGDRYKFRQALINIGKNAIEAMNQGGSLRLKAFLRHDGVVMIISDTGAGMTPEQVKRLGTPFYSTKEKGTGLGTMVSFGIIKKMDGKIEIESEPGKGTTYTLLFPAAE